MGPACRMHLAHPQGRTQITLTPRARLQIADTRVACAVRTRTCCPLPRSYRGPESVHAIQMHAIQMVSRDVPCAVPCSASEKSAAPQNAHASTMAHVAVGDAMSHVRDVHARVVCQCIACPLWLCARVRMRVCQSTARCNPLPFSTEARALGGRGVCTALPTGQTREAPGRHPTPGRQL